MATFNPSSDEDDAVVVDAVVDGVVDRVVLDMGGISF
jgi:hypothetical protein